MSDKYCPAGKVECLHYHDGNKCCALDPHFCETNLNQIEVCPWPSRQVPVRPYAEDCAVQEAERLYAESESEMTENRCNGDGCQKDDAYAAGRLFGLREAREAVDNMLSQHWIVKPHGTIEEPFISRDDAIAAIDRLMEGK